LPISCNKPILPFSLEEIYTDFADGESFLITSHAVHDDGLLLYISIFIPSGDIIHRVGAANILFEFHVIFMETIAVGLFKFIFQFVPSRNIPVTQLVVQLLVSTICLIY
jgi:hypothetical protein